MNGNPKGDPPLFREISADKNNELRSIMDDRSTENLERATELLIEGRLYLLAGAGLSCRAGIPAWPDLLNDFASGYEKRPYLSEARAGEIKRFAARCDLDLFEVMRNDEQGNIALIDVLKRHFWNKKCDTIHKELLNLPFKAVVTTNYDTCFENACTTYGVCPELVENRWFCFPEYNARTIDIDQMLNGEKFLLHMHGCFCRAEEGHFEVENIILTRSQYTKFYRRDEMCRILKTLKDSHVLFLGTSLTDRYFLDAVTEFRKTSNLNERANAKVWFKICSGGDDCSPIRDEEVFKMYHIHYEKANDGFGDIIRKIIRSIDSRKQAVTNYPDPENPAAGRGI